MRIFLRSRHRYPARRTRSKGHETVAHPSNASGQIHDLIARGLAELGHKVYYQVDTADAPPPAGVTFVEEGPPANVDVVHNLPSSSRPWVFTQHNAHMPRDSLQLEHAIFVSPSLAARYGSDRYVLNGLDPAHYVYREEKDDYLLFLSGMEGDLGRKYLDKGLDIALELSRDLGFRLWVAGGASNTATIDAVTRLCHDAGAEYLGDVGGAEKAELLANARALLFPTRLSEGCGLVMIEALMSGTPIVAMDRGGCRDLVTPDVGFLCTSRRDFECAIESLGTIQPRACRDRAAQECHYMKMAAGYVREYRRLLDAPPGWVVEGKIPRTRPRAEAGKTRSSNPILRRLGYGARDRVVVIHVDDVGMVDATLEGLTRLLDTGLELSASVMVPGPGFAAAARFARVHPEVDLGLHLTLTSEWADVRWGPLSTRDPGSGLLDEEGRFPRQPEGLAEASLRAVSRELAAQLASARASGLDVSHLDSHMFTLLEPRLLPAYLELGLTERLPAYLPQRAISKLDDTPRSAHACTLVDLWRRRGFAIFDHRGNLPLGQPEVRLERAKAVFDALPPGLTHFPIHPAAATPELRAMTHNWRGRAADLEAFAHPALRRHLRDTGIQLIRYRALRQALPAVGTLRSGPAPPDGIT